MKIIFFGAGYCTNFIIPLLKKMPKLTQKNKIKEKFDKKFNVKRLVLRNF